MARTGPSCPGGQLNLSKSDSASFGPVGGGGCGGVFQVGMYCAIQAMPPTTSTKSTMLTMRFLDTGTPGRSADGGARLRACPRCRARPEACPTASSLALVQGVAQLGGAFVVLGGDRLFELLVQGRADGVLLAQGR